MGEKGNERFDKPQQMAGRLGDIDFVGLSRTKGKVYRDRYLQNLFIITQIHH